MILLSENSEKELMMRVQLYCQRIQERGWHSWISSINPWDLSKLSLKCTKYRFLGWLTKIKMTHSMTRWCLQGLIVRLCSSPLMLSASLRALILSGAKTICLMRKNFELLFTYIKRENLYHMKSWRKAFYNWMMAWLITCGFMT